MDNKKFALIVGLIFLGAMSRLIPHPHNFTPIAAMGLFAAHYIRPNLLGAVVPFLAMWLSDLLVINVIYPNYYNGFQWFGHLWVYVAFGLIFFMGKGIHKAKPLRLLGFSLSASLVFFIVSNFGVWLGSAIYSQSLIGLLACYTAALPFFANTILGDLFYVSAFFGIFELVNKKYLQSQSA
jgi:hypothetical protein